MLSLIANNQIELSFKGVANTLTNHFSTISRKMFKLNNRLYLERSLNPNKQTISFRVFYLENYLNSIVFKRNLS